jgi:Lysyl oxidase
LRLSAPLTQAVVIRPTAAPVILQAVPVIASPDHDIAWRLTRPAGSAKIAAARLDGATATRVPEGIISLFGVLQFGHFTVTGPTGSLIARSDLAWCPANHRTQLAQGQATAIYPELCNASPFATGVEWGIERGWAADLPLGVNVDGPDGVYNVTVTIAKRAGDALGFAGDGRTVTFPIVLRTDGSTAGQPATDSAGRQPLESETAHQPPDAALATVEPPAGSLPDVRPLPAYGISTSADGATDLLNFNASVWNAGARFVVDGYRAGDPAVMQASQLFYEGSRLVATKPAGTFEYHAGGGHNHWHFLDFVRYDLLDSNGTQVATSGKEAWCLANTTAVDLLMPNAEWRPATFGLNTACGSESAKFLRETLSPGWGDTYSQAVSGQALDITHVANGSYRLQIVTNPAGRFVERSMVPETSLRDIQLGGRAGARTVSVAPADGIDG